MIQITTLAELMYARSIKKSVICPKYSLLKPKPASWVINYSGAILFHMFQSGMYIYDKKEIHFKENKNVSTL